MADEPGTSLPGVIRADKDVCCTELGACCCRVEPSPGSEPAAEADDDDKVDDIEDEED